MNKILSVDWGEKKSGIAISDEMAISAKPLLTIRSSIVSFKKLIKEEKPSLVLFGRPREMDGSLGKQAKKVEKFAKELQDKISVDIIFEDETNTTRLAKSQMIKEGIDPRKNKGLIDQKSAQIILEGYLNENKN